MHAFPKNITVHALKSSQNYKWVKSQTLKRHGKITPIYKIKVQKCLVQAFSHYTSK